MSVFRILAEEIENWYANQPTVSLINEGDKKYYYHGRNTGARPYYGKYIFITDSFGYASGYGDGKVVHVYTLPFGEDRLFSIRNPHHLNQLRKYIDDYTISVIFKSSNNDEEIDWAALSYIGTDEFEQPEDLFEHLGYYGIKLKERTGINSIYVFDEKYLTYEGTIDLTTPEMQNKIRQFYHDFEKNKHFVEEENEVTGNTKTPQEIADSLVTDPRFNKTTVLVNLDVQLADEAFKRDEGFYIGKDDKGIGIRKEKVMELIKSGELKYAPEASIYLTNDGKPRLSFGDGRHRFAVLRDLGVKTINISIWNAPQSRKLIPLLQRNDQNSETQNQWKSYTAEEIAKHIYNLLTPEQQEENDWNFNEYYNTIKGFGEAYELIDINPNNLKFNEDFDFDTVENYEHLMKQNSPIPEIVIDVDNGIIDGNHRAKAAMNLGKTIKAYRAIQQYANESNDIPKINETTYKVYHGTNEKFGNFNFNKATQGIIWFTDSIDSIQKGEHGGQGNKYIMTRYITINNPAGWKEYEKYGLQQLQDMGYDGVILPQGDKTDYFVFNNKSISAKGTKELQEAEQEKLEQPRQDKTGWKKIYEKKYIKAGTGISVHYKIKNTRSAIHRIYEYNGYTIHEELTYEKNGWMPTYIVCGFKNPIRETNAEDAYCKRFNRPFNWQEVDDTEKWAYDEMMKKINTADVSEIVKFVNDNKEEFLAHLDKVTKEFNPKSVGKAFLITMGLYYPNNMFPPEGLAKIAISKGMNIQSLDDVRGKPSNIILNNRKLMGRIKNSDLLKETRVPIFGGGVDEEEDYRGQHTAPTSEDSPMYDVTNAFGEDIYTDKALRMFGMYGSYDSYSIALIQRARNKPNMPVKIYRAVPAVLTNQDRLNDYEKQKLYILKTGRLPKGVDNWRNSSEYYDWLSNEVDRLRGLPQEPEEKVKINNGDWVTINPAYAKVHGQSNLNNKYKVISKTVPAKNLFTDGNSIHEWGYVGNDLNEETNNENAIITPKDVKLVGSLKTDGYESIIEAYVYPNQSRSPIKYEFLSSINLDKYSNKVNGTFNQQPKSFNDKDLIKIEIVLDYENIENYVANRKNISTEIKNQFKKQLADKLNQPSQTIDERKKKRQKGMALPLGQIFTGGMLQEQTEPIERKTAGDCYKNVQDYLLDNDIPYATIVHGVVTSRNGTLNHAWIETDEDVYDPTTGVKTDKEKYYAKLNPQVHARYTFTDAIKLRFTTGHYGPWTETTNEGVADKYAEKAFNIPDTGENDYYKATAALPPDPSMGTYVVNVYDDEFDPMIEKGKLLSRVFMNPKNLTKFGKNVRAVSDINGNFYIAETDAPFFHQELQDALWNKGIHDSFMQWYRMGLSNLFTLSGSYMELYRKQTQNTEETYLKNLKAKNPQFRFLTRQNTEVANEGVADNARERMFNIPNPEAEMDYQATRHLEPTSDMGEYVGDIVIGDEFQTRVFKNPKSLDKFGNSHGGSVKAISFPNGDIYIAEKDAFFFHNDILRSLNLPRSPYIGWYASNYNDAFSMAMSSFDKKSMDNITKMRDVVQYRFPQFKFNIE